jgi:tight adherence protein B
MIWIVTILGLIGLGTVVGGFILSRQAEKSLDGRIGIQEDRAVEADAEQERSSPLGETVNRIMQNRGIGKDLAVKLARADVKLTVGEFVVINFTLVLGAGVLAYILRGKDILVIVGACALGFFAPRIYLTILRNRRLKAFNDQLGDTITLMVNGIRAGYSILQAMNAVAEEMSPPISVEFERIVQEVQLGIPMEEALDHMLERAPSDDLDMLITAINVQREVGGNLAEVLDSIAFTIRERVRIKGEIKTLTAQSRLSGYIIALVPVILGVIIYLINPGFMGKMFQDTCGYIMLGVAFAGIVAGFFVINKVVSIEV